MSEDFACAKFAQVTGNDEDIRQDKRGVTVKIAKSFVESEFEQYRVI